MESLDLFRDFLETTETGQQEFNEIPYTFFYLRDYIVFYL